ncbi:MAG TPA: CxxxxCH/CxxCH domain-containing protein [Myxococcales bacterium]|nr:CxxxxCH/CxxCH domain-containing protein [Myxococcales bacterium]
MSALRPARSPAAARREARLHGLAAGTPGRAGPLHRRAAAAAALLAFVLAAAGCGIARDPAQGQPRCPDYDAQIAPVLAGGCADCHGGAAPAGGYSVADRLLVLARRDDGSPRLVPGDAASDFLAAARGDRAGHTALPAEQVALLEDWAVRCRAAPRALSVHPPGWTTPTDPEQFHGAALRADAYELEPCRQCHGADLGGGTSAVACSSCHPQGPLACNTCHGDARSPAPPRDLSGARATTSLGVGAHRSHTSDCTACHVLPAVPEQEGHYRSGGRLDASPAEVILPSAPGLTARWDRESATCSGVACHAPAGADARATNQAPRWTNVGAGEAACGSCHGLPPEDHGDSGNDCARCHGVAYAGGQLLASKHANGVVDVGDGQGTGCSACHGDVTSPAPPRDTAGRTDESVASVGAHRAHLEARHHLRGPIACVECHQVPSARKAPGHIDSALPAEVFPAVSGVGTLARADGAAPVYDAARATCGSVYCHGAGTLAAGDTALTRIPAPSWTGGTSQAVCGACHGIPPADTLHDPAFPLTYCSRCHGPSINTDGSIRITADPVTGTISSTHLDGLVTLGAPVP